MRNWKNFDNDEIFGIWKSFLRTEFVNDPLRIHSILDKKVRLTPNEIIGLVEELIERLEIKEGKVDDRNN